MISLVLRDPSADFKSYEGEDAEAGEGGEGQEGEADENMIVVSILSLVPASGHWPIRGGLSDNIRLDTN